MTTQIQASDRHRAEDEIFALRKKIDRYLAVGDTDEVSRLQREISELQRKHGAVIGRGKDENHERTA